MNVIWPGPTRHRLLIELDGTSDIFRFAINMLDDQVEFAAAGRAILVELGEGMGPARYAAMAQQLLGEDRYKKLEPWLRRDTHCLACERELATDDLRRNVSNAQIVCEECAGGDLVFADGSS